MGRQKTLARKTTADSRKIVERIRAELEAGKLDVSDVLRSERELAEEHRVSRRTVRRALKQLVEDGWLVAKPRGGYLVTTAPGVMNGKGPVAFVHGSPGMPWEWSDFNMALWNGFQSVGSQLAQNMLVISIADRQPEELARSLKAQGACGAIVDSDHLEITDAILEAGIPAVQVDALHAKAPSVMQDNFAGALAATRQLIKKGCRRIAFLGCEFPQNPNHLHLEERLGGYLSALARSDIEARPQWQVLGRPVNGAVDRLVELADEQGGPDAAVVLWPELLPGLGAALSCGKLKIPVVVWWGCIPERREKWRKNFPDLAVPDGIAWGAEDLARMAFARLEVMRKSRELNLGRSLVPARLLPGEEK
jgi:DNA-binding LacI/PurR family transcriptional regulator